LVGQSDVLVRFKAISDYGDNFFADNINIELYTGSFVNEIEGITNMEVFPNPATENFTVKLELENNLNADLSVSNSVGQKVYEINNSELNPGANLFNISTTDFAPGIYTVSMVNGANTLTRKLVIK